MRERDVLRVKLLVEKEIDTLVKERSILSLHKEREDPNSSVYKYLDGKIKSNANRIGFLKKKWRVVDGVFYRH